MSADIESVVLEKMRISGSTDISGHAQLLARVHFCGRRSHQRKRPVLKGIAIKKQQEREYIGSHQNILSKEDLRGKTA